MIIKDTINQEDIIAYCAYYSKALNMLKLL